MTRAVPILLLAAAALLVPSAAARAQCGATRTQCRACHEEQGRRPVLADGTRWHDDHALGDFCVQCHGGDGEAAAERPAHVGLRDPLLDAAASCRSCHDDAAGLIERYRTLRAGRARAPAPAIAVTTPTATPGVKWPDLWLAAAILAIALGGAVWVGVREHRPWWRARRARGADGSPYAGGVLLGLLATVSLAVDHRLAGASGYQHLSGLVGRLLAPRSVYWQHVVPTGLTWDVWVLVGGVGGALASSLLGGTFRIRTMPDREWTDVFGPSVAKRWILAFAGSALTAVGAGIAGGCTASLAISGGAALVPGAFLFVAAMFATGTPLALWLHAPPRRPR